MGSCNTLAHYPGRCRRRLCLGHNPREQVKKPDLYLGSVHCRWLDFAKTPSEQRTCVSGKLVAIVALEQSADAASTLMPDLTMPLADPSTRIAPDAIRHEATNLTGGGTVLDDRAIRAWICGRIMFFELTDGRQIGFPLDRFRRLHEASDEQLAAVTLWVSGSAVRWESIDEDITVISIIEDHFQLALPANHLVNR